MSTLFQIMSSILQGSAKKISKNVRFHCRTLNFGNAIIPRRIFGPKRDEVTGEWRK
jgi:hypothetical protein